MPLWKVYHPVGAYTRDEKQAFSAAVTEIYGRIMPKFYVGVVFQEVDEDSFFIGGEARSNFVRIWIDHSLGPSHRPMRRSASSTSRTRSSPLG